MTLLHWGAGCVRQSGMPLRVVAAEDNCQPMPGFVPNAVSPNRTPEAPPRETMPTYLRDPARCATIMRSLCVISLGSVLLLALSGCAPVSRSIPLLTGVLLEDAFGLKAANGQALSGESRRPPHFSLVRAGTRRNGLLLVAPEVVSAPLPGLAGKMEFRCFVAPVYNIGDGVILEIVLEAEDRERVLLRRRLDAGRRAEDRQWNELVVPLQIPRDGASLLLRASGGDPEDNPGTGVDLVADWLVIADPRLTTE
jgi:hypothetical protein